MARPIKETPILFGDDARRFESRMREKRQLTSNQRSEMEQDYETVKQWFENGRVYDEQLRAQTACPQV